MAFDARDGERLHMSVLFIEASFFKKVSRAKPSLTVFSLLQLFEMIVRLSALSHFIEVL